MITDTARNYLDSLRHQVGGALDRFSKKLQGRESRKDELPATTNVTNGNYLFSASLAHGGAPAIDVKELDNEVLVTAEVPGLTPDDFAVEFISNRLVLRGQKKSERKEEKEDYFYSEKGYSSFYRSIPLPCEVDADRADAKLRNGILKLHLPKTEDAKNKKVQVKVD